jgi:hypothetical protein
MSREYKSPDSYLDPENKIKKYIPEDDETTYAVSFEEFFACGDNEEESIENLVRLMYTVYREFRGDYREITTSLLLEYGFEFTKGWFEDYMFSYEDFIVTFKPKSEFFDEGFYYVGHDYIKLENMQDVKNVARVLFNINLRDV